MPTARPYLSAGTVAAVWSIRVVLAAELLAAWAPAIWLVMLLSSWDS